MFKKLLPLIVVLALLAVYASYRVASAQAASAGEIARATAQMPDTGAAVRSWTNLSTGDAARARSYVDPNDCNTPRPESPKARAGPVASC